MSSNSPEMRALLIGVERYPNQGGTNRPGTLQALREINHRLQVGGWKTRLLTDDSTSNTHRSGLTQILEGLSWISGEFPSVVVISTRIQDQRLYPLDYKENFIQQSTLALADLCQSLSPHTGLILDGAVTPEITENLLWSTAAETLKVCLEMAAQRKVEQYGFLTLRKPVRLCHNLEEKKKAIISWSISEPTLESAFLKLASGDE